MKIDWVKLLISIVGCELIGLLGTPFTASAIPNWYVGLEKPFFAPPNWIFGPVWILLYCMMGISIYLIWTSKAKKNIKKTAITFFLIQLALNCIWSPLFFGLRSPLLGLIDIVAMWAFIVLTIKKFNPVSKNSAYLLYPYLAWVSFATLLNAAILFLN